MCQPDSFSRATRAKMLAGGRPCGSGELALVQCEGFKRLFFEVFEVFVVRFSSRAKQFCVFA